MDTTEVCDKVPSASSRVYAIYHDRIEHPGGPFLPGWPVNLSSPSRTRFPCHGREFHPFAHGRAREAHHRIGMGGGGFFPQIIHYKEENIEIRTTLPGVNIHSVAGGLSLLYGSGELSFLFPAISSLDLDEMDLHLLYFRIAAGAVFPSIGFVGLQPSHVERRSVNRIIQTDCCCLGISDSFARAFLAADPYPSSEKKMSPAGRKRTGAFPSHASQVHIARTYLATLIPGAQDHLARSFFADSQSST